MKDILAKNYSVLVKTVIGFLENTLAALNPKTFMTFVQVWSTFELNWKM